MANNIETGQINEKTKDKASDRSVDDSTGKERRSSEDEKSTVAFDINKSQSDEGRTDKTSSNDEKGEAFRVNKDQ